MAPKAKRLTREIRERRHRNLQWLFWHGRRDGLPMSMHAENIAKDPVILQWFVEGAAHPHGRADCQSFTKKLAKDLSASSRSNRPIDSERAFRANFENHMVPVLKRLSKRRNPYVADAARDMLAAGRSAMAHAAR